MSGMQEVESRSRSEDSSDLDERLIRTSPKKPYDVADPIAKDPLRPCTICGRNFSAVNLERHVPICERIFTKPKRETFNTVTQRLAHVAQESAVQPVIQGSLVKHSNEASLKSSGLLEDLTKKPVKRKKKSPTVRSGNTGEDLFREQQKGLLQCPSCDRYFREEAHERHVEFCKEQLAGKQHRGKTIDPKADLLLLRMKYRPPPLKKRTASEPLKYAPKQRTHVSASKSAPMQQRLHPSSQNRPALPIIAPSRYSAELNKVVRKVKDLDLSKVKQKESSKHVRSPIEAFKQSLSKTYTDLSVELSKAVPSPTSTSISSKLGSVRSWILEKNVKSLQGAGDSSIFGTKDAAVIRMRGKRRTSQKVHEVEPVADLSSAIQYTEKWSDHIDSFLLPAVTKAPVPEYDKHRFFQRVGGTYCAPPMEKSSLTRLPDIVDSNPAEEHVSSRGSSQSSSPASQAVADWKVCQKVSSTIHAKDLVLVDSAALACRHCGKIVPIPEASFCCFCGRIRCFS